MRGAFSIALVLFVSFSCVSGVLGSQDSETYAEEYELYQKIEAESGNAKKRELIFEFLDTFEASVLDPNVSYQYAQYYNGPRQSGQWQQLANLALDYLRRRPNDGTAIAAATEAYQNLGDTRKLVDFGSKLYNDSPNANTAYFVAKAYQSLNDQANFRSWGQRVVRHDPNNLQILVELSNSYWRANDFTNTVTYAKQALQATEKAQKLDSQTDAQWNAQLNQVRGFCYRALGEADYVNKNNRAARGNFEKAVEFDVKNDFAHYRLGLIYWGAGRTNQAVLALAKAFVLNGPSSKEARDQLNQLYRSVHGSTSGLPTVIQRARQDVGL
jgi:tetratricopeptide (TPR) repeat protein